MVFIRNALALVWRSYDILRTLHYSKHNNFIILTKYYSALLCKQNFQK